MIRMRTKHIALLMTAVAIFGLAAGALAADRMFRAKVPDIT